MPAKKGMKKSGRKPRAPKPKRKVVQTVTTKVTRRPRQQPRGTSSRTVSTTAPAGVSTNRRMTLSYSSGMVGGRSSLKISACVPLCEVGNDAFNNGLFIQHSTTAFYASTAQLDPTAIPNTLSASATTPIPVAASNWISPHVPLLSVAFDRYRITGLTFHYEPQSTTTVADRLVFAWTDDPVHPFLSPFSGLVPPQLDLLVTQDSMAFAPWKPWSLQLPVSSEPKYLYQPDSSGPSVSDRFSAFGCFSCVGSAAPSSQILYGILYASVQMEFFDPVPIVAAPVLSNFLSHRARFRKPESKEEKKEDSLSIRSLRSVDRGEMEFSTLPPSPQSRVPPSNLGNVPPTPKVPSRK